MTTRRRGAAARAVVLFALVTIGLSGFVFHTSNPTPTMLLGKYSPAYAVALSVLGIAWIGIGAWLWRERGNLGRRLRPTLAVAGICLLVGWLILPSAYIFVHHKALARDVFAPMKPGAHAFFQLDTAPDPAPSRGSDALRVLCLGGSTTYGSALPRADRYPPVLEKILRQQFPGRRVDVINAGIPWHTTMHSLLRYVSRYADWQPDVVLVMHAFNDIYQTSEGHLTTGQFRADYGHFFGALGNRVNPVDQLAGTLNAVMFENPLTRLWFSDFRASLAARPRPTVDLLRSLPSYRRNLGHLIRRARDDNALVVVMSEPYVYRADMTSDEQQKLFYSFYYADYAVVPTLTEQIAAMRAFNLAGREVAQANYASFVDLEAMLPKTWEMMYDDVHHTSRGARVVAEAIAASVPWPRVSSDAQSPAR